MSFKHSRLRKYLLLLLGLLLLYSVFIEPYWIQVNEIQILDEPFASFFKYHKTIFISDLHATKIGIRESFLLGKINQISPEIILFGGDLVAWSGDYQAAFEFLSKLKAREGVYGVLGESDFQNNRKSCVFCHRFDRTLIPFSAKFLQNQAVHPYFNQPGIFGVDIGSLDPEVRQSSGLSTLKEAAIILSHRQADLDEIPPVPALVLSGDTHGGQVWMPDWFWHGVFGKSKGSIRKGIRRSGNKILVVTSGIGVSHFPVRFLCPPEILLFKGK